MLRASNASPRHRLWLFFLVFVALVAASGCKKKAPQTLRDDIAGMQIVVPAGFKVGPLGKEGQAATSMRLQAGDFVKDIGAGVVSEAKADLADITTLDQYIEASNTNRTNVLKKMDVKSQQAKRCGVHKCVDMEIRGASNGLNLVYFVRYIEADAYFHQVMAWTSPSRLEQNRAVMEGVLDSYADIPR